MHAAPLHRVALPCLKSESHGPVDSQSALFFPHLPCPPCLSGCHVFSFFSLLCPIVTFLVLAHFSSSGCCSSALSSSFLPYPWFLSRTAIAMSWSSALRTHHALPVASSLSSCLASTTPVPACSISEPHVTFWSPPAFLHSLSCDQGQGLIIDIEYTYARTRRHVS